MKKLMLIIATFGILSALQVQALNDKKIKRIENKTNNEVTISSKDGKSQRKVNAGSNKDINLAIGDGLHVKAFPGGYNNPESREFDITIDDNGNVLVTNAFNTADFKRQPQLKDESEITVIVTRDGKITLR